MSASARGALWPAIAVGAAAAVSVAAQLALLEQDPAARARLVVIHAGVAGFAVALIAFALARWLDRFCGRAPVAIAIVAMILIGLPTAMAGFYAIYDRTWLGHIDDETLAEGILGVLIAHAGAVYIFATIGMRLLFPWPAPLVALIGGLIAWRQRR